MMKKINPATLSENTFSLIGSDWMLITAGSEEKYNTMTASWGGLGVLWRKNVAFIFIRPQRYTYEMVERNDTFTLSFFDESYRSALNLCGSKSGREVDKAAATGLTPVFEDGTVYFSQARLVIKCKKIYHHDLAPENFLEDYIASNYHLKDYHRMYIGEIVECLVSE